MLRRRHWNKHWNSNDNIFRYELPYHDINKKEKWTSILLPFHPLCVTDSFILLRACQGGCLDDAYYFKEWKAGLTMFMSGLIFHVPSSICYFLIYYIVKKHQKAQVPDYL